jgi:hypothetical protein
MHVSAPKMPQYHFTPPKMPQMHFNGPTMPNMGNMGQTKPSKAAHAHTNSGKPAHTHKTNAVATEAEAAPSTSTAATTSTANGTEPNGPREAPKAVGITPAETSGTAANVTITPPATAKAATATPTPASTAAASNTTTPNATTAAATTAPGAVVATSPGRYYGGGRRYYGYGRYWRRSYYRPTNQMSGPMRRLRKLIADLDALTPGTQVTQVHKNMLKNDLMAVAEHIPRPTTPPVQLLADHLADGLTHRTVPLLNTMELAGDLKAVMNAAHISNGAVKTASTESQMLLKGSGVKQADVTAIANDLKAVVASLPNPQAMGNVR